MLSFMISEHARRIARRAVEQIGRRPQIRRYYSADESLSVDVATVDDWPRAGVRAGFTVDLTNEPLGLGEDEYELIAVADLRWDKLLDLLGEAGLRVRRGTLVVDHGQVGWDLMGMVYEGLDVRHLIILKPLEEQLRLAVPAEGTSLGVRWLQGVPITQEEAEEYEGAAPEHMLERLAGRRYDLTNWGRTTLR
jgi:hypothetical protein